MGLDDANYIRFDFPPLPAPDSGAALTYDDALRIIAVLIDWAAGVRTNMYAAVDIMLAYMFARAFGDSMRARFPYATDFYIMLEGDVPAAKKYEQKKRSAARTETLRRKGVLLDAPLAGQPALPRPLEAAADAAAAARGVDRGTLTLREVLKQYARRGVAALAAEKDEFEPGHWRQMVVHECMPELERIAMDSILEMRGGVRGHVAQILVNGADVLVGEGERKALPFARHLGVPCVIYGNDSDLFVMAMMQVPKYPNHPPVYYYDIARSRGKATHVIDLVACVRAMLARGGPPPEARALALLLCGNDYVRAADAEPRMTMHKLAGNRWRPRTPPDTAPEEKARLDQEWMREDAGLAFAAVAAALVPPALVQPAPPAHGRKRPREEPDRLAEGATAVDRLTALLWLHFPARQACSRALAKMRVLRAMVALRYYEADTRAQEPTAADWCASGWRTPEEPWTLDNIEHYVE